MKAKVRLSYSVELFVEGVNKEAIMDWLAYTTPLEAKRCAEKYGNIVTENYDEEIICEVTENSEVDYVIKKGVRENENHDSGHCLPKM